MKALTHIALAWVVLAAATPASAQVTFYESQGFQGRDFTTESQVPNFARFGFNDRASSATVTGERWEVCEDERYRGRCVVLRPGQYPTLAAMGLNNRISSVRTINRNKRIEERRYAPAPPTAQITFFEGERFSGSSFATDRLVEDFRNKGFNDRVSSLLVTGPDQWEACEDIRFSGSCVVLRPGQYPTLRGTGLNDRISSVRNTATKAPAPAPAPATAKITFYEDERFGGRSFTTDALVENFREKGFNDRVSSLVVAGPDQWEACEDIRFSGSCVVLRPGQYPTLRGTGLNDRISSVRNTATRPSAPDLTQITFFENDGFTGRSITTDRPLEDLTRSGFNDRASSVVVVGDGRWEVCDDARFDGRCMVLRPGQYPSLTAMGMNDRISSVRAVGRDARIDDQRYAPVPLAAPDYRKRGDERLYVVNVTSVRAVVGTPEKRCWVERGQVPAEQTKANVPGALVGALLGGILGHQVGGGTGKDIATAGGVIAGAVIGSKVGGNANAPQGATQDVQRCEAVPSQASTQYWDVTYSFRGQEHRIQMTAPPGPTITVNEQGEPRN